MDNNTIIVQKDRQHWLLFTRAVAVLQTSQVQEVGCVLEEVENATRRGSFAAGFIAYEAAPAFDRAYETFPPSAIPLVWFGIYQTAEELSSLPTPHASFGAGPWLPCISRDEYCNSVEDIRRYIAAGDTYQVNFTFRLRSRFAGDPYSFFHALCRSQQADHCAFVNLDSIAIASASPEMFFEINDTTIISRPMKGTAPRALTTAADDAAFAALGRSEKNQAENVMIVDMVRNDLGRVAEAGTVRVRSLFDVERYPTVLQMTSTVEASTSAPFADIVAALFPCASITGAPKVRTMQIIRELETCPRGIYTGMIGYFGPQHSDGRRSAKFNVAIRTVTIDKKTSTAEYGVGGGIVWDSAGAGEYEECLAKASVLTAEFPDFRLLETILWTPDEGYFLLDEHLDRLSQSARYFGFPLDMNKMSECLIPRAETVPEGSHVVRLLLDRSGQVILETKPGPETDQQKPFQMGIASSPVDSQDVFLYHKTTCRSVYESARNSRPDCDDVILHNEKGEVTESSIANIVVEIGGRKFTPPVACGLLDGIFRRHLLSQGTIHEKVLSLDDLRTADALYLVNSVRRWIPARLHPGDRLR